MADAPQSQTQPKKMGAAFGKWTKEHPAITAAAAVFLLAVLYASFVAGLPTSNTVSPGNGEAVGALPPRGSPLNNAPPSSAIPAGVPAVNPLSPPLTVDNPTYQTFIGRCNEQADKRRALGINVTPQMTDNGPGGIGHCHIDATFSERGAI